MFKKSLLFVVSATLTIFVGLIFYNQNLAQKALLSAREAPLGIELVSYPETTRVGNRNTFIWRVNATNDLTTDFSTVYWSNGSSPSALTKGDSPEALKYERFSTDFTSSSSFFLPYDFESTIVFDKPQTVYFRAYAKVRDDHLWSEEKKIIVQP